MRQVPYSHHAQLLVSNARYSAMLFTSRQCCNKYITVECERWHVFLHIPFIVALVAKGFGCVGGKCITVSTQITIQRSLFLKHYLIASHPSNLKMLASSNRKPMRLRASFGITNWYLLDRVTIVFCIIGTIIYIESLNKIQI